MSGDPAKSEARRDSSARAKAAERSRATDDERSRATDDESSRAADESPPFGRSWAMLYAAVLLNLALLVVLFYLFTRAFR